MYNFSYLLFCLIFLATSNWLVVKNFLIGNFIQKKTKKVVDKKLIAFIHKKTGILLPYITLQESDKSFAYCGMTMTLKPLFVLSTTAYKKFTDGAMEWLVLHEIGHYALFHTFWHIGVDLAYLILGITFLGFLPQSFTFVIAIILALILASISIQTKKLFDIWANHYAVVRLDNPDGMADGAKILMNQAKESGIYKDTLMMKLFYPWNYAMWEKTTADAKKEIEQRKSK